MKKSMEAIKDAIECGKIQFYEDKIIKSLRNVTFQGFPASIAILSEAICHNACYPMSMLLTKTMSQFKLVHGNTNHYLKDDIYPSHSWVEKDGYVYDTSEGLKIEKSWYYQFYEPEVVEWYDQDSVVSYPFYQEVMHHCNQEPYDKAKLAIIFRYLEMLEEEKTSVNHTLLLDEIQLYREKYKILKKVPSEIMDTYCEMMRKKL